MDSLTKISFDRSIRGGDLIIVLKEASRLYAASWVRDIGPDFKPNDYRKDDGTEGKSNGDKSRNTETEPSTLEDIAIAAIGGLETLGPALQRLYITRASAYRDALKSFIEGYPEGIQYKFRDLVELGWHGITRMIHKLHISPTSSMYSIECVFRILRILLIDSSMKISFNCCIRNEDLIIVYERHDTMKAVKVCENSVLQTCFGVSKHSDWIGKPFGSIIFSNRGGFVYLLALTQELWTLVLSHRTQILYIADISFVIVYLEVVLGCLVLESGTDSGSLTTSFARAVAPTGHVYTFDFHEERAASGR
ncbi:hypothetical protein CXB51_003731 [Gossypium anomalum]|uniref:tRNA (adenine(58)-N(1))-methyltransferase n=1 Tax=Gossypium anomalum TaxID=47600 RepID=A0A8J5ZXS7_9ROSI|nr:hypothetical protein CXB51_003731 [Gossypium anomalum]